MRFQLLGPLSIADGDEEAVLQPSKPTVLLAALLVHPNVVVSTGYLLRAVWGEEQPATAKAALHTCVLRLRRIFAKYGIADNAIEAVPGGYRIPADPASLDLLAFRELLASAAALTDPEAELSALQQGLALWKGPLLANVPSDALHRDEVPRLTEERLRATERVCDIQLSLGRCREVLVELWGAARSHPGHERFWEQLIEALYRTGRQSEALAEYRRVKGHLLDELGVEPGPGLRALELAILRGDPLGLPGPPARTPLEPAALRTAAPVSAVPATSFSGRTAESLSIAARLTADSDGPRTVVLSGAPGIGKTALALHVAQLVEEDFPDGRATVVMRHPDGTPRTAAEVAAELPPCGGDRRTLLVLDDVSHADQVRPLLPGGRGSAVIITSRRGLAGLMATHSGWTHRLDTLDAQGSERLLTAVLGQGRVSAEPEAARRLTELCGRHPLALRIVAARLLTRPGLRLTDCAEWIEDDPAARLSLPDDPRMSVPAVLREALGRLDAEHADAFVRLGRHEDHRLGVREGPGLRVADCAKALEVADRTAEELLERLVDEGLLEEGPPGHYRMHALLRTFARSAVGLPETAVPR